jgi:ABC-type uncharacterized transport system permease subunit
VSLDLHALTAGVYLVAAVLATLGASLRHAGFARAAVGALAVGALVHACAFFAFHDFQFPPPSTGLPGAVSLMAWFGTIFYLAVAARVRGLAVVVAPAAFLGVFFVAIARGAGAEAPAEAGPLWGAVHVLLSSAGLALGGVAGAAGVLFVLHHQRLKRKRSRRSRLRLPPLEALDRVNSLAVSLGFLFISLGVVTGVLWVHETRGELWPGGSPHANAMLAAWAIYGALVSARVFSATGALLAARASVVGFAFLALAVVGVEMLG